MTKIITEYFKQLYFLLTYDEVAMKCRRPLGKSLFLILFVMTFAGIACSQVYYRTTYDGKIKVLVVGGGSFAPPIEEEPNETLVAGAYVVDGINGSDSASGDVNNPWRTIAKACNTVVAGKTVYIKGSTNPLSNDCVYMENLPIVTPGTAGNRITFRNYPGHTVILRGTGGGNGIQGNQMAFNTVKGLTFNNFNKAMDSYGSWSSSYAQIYNFNVEDCIFDTFSETGLRIRNFTDCNFTNVTVKSTAEMAIFCGYCFNIKFTNCKAYNNLDSDDGDGFHVEYDSNDITFINCESYNNGEDGFDLSGTCTMINCISRNNASSGYRTHLRSTDTPPYAAHTLKCINCVAYLNGTGENGAGWNVNDGTELILYNCIAYAQTNIGIAFSYGHLPATPVMSQLYNTIIMSNGSTGIITYDDTYMPYTLNNCLIYDDDTSNEAANNNPASGDPLFYSPSTGVFAVKSGSPCIDAGIAIADANTVYQTYMNSSVAKDVYGNNRSGAWNIGVHESSNIVGNHAPVFTHTPTGGTLTVGEMSTLSYTFIASDSDGDSLRYYIADGSQTGMSLNFTSGVFTWTPTNLQAGVYDVNFAVTDEHFYYPPALTKVTITVTNVNAAPSYVGLGTYTQVATRKWWYALKFTDVDLQTLTYSSTNLPSGATIDDANGYVTWTPTAGQVGNHLVSFTASDGTAEYTKDVNFLVLPSTPYTAVTDEAHIYYIDDTNGSDSADGQTTSTPWKTFTKANNTIAAGDMVYVRGGTYNVGASIIMNSGTSGNYKIYKNYNSETVTLTNFNFRSYSYIIFDGFIFNANDVAFYNVFNDTMFLNCTFDGGTYALSECLSNRMRVENCTFVDVPYVGIEGCPSNLHVYNCDVNNVGRKGILGGDNSQIISSTFENCPNDFALYCNGGSMFIYDSTITGNDTDLRIDTTGIVRKESSTITDVSNSGTYIDGDL